jgi:hypothetical protein
LASNPPTSTSLQWQSPGSQSMALCVTDGARSVHLPMAAQIKDSRPRSSFPFFRPAGNSIVTFFPL